MKITTWHNAISNKLTLTLRLSAGPTETGAAADRLWGGLKLYNRRHCTFHDSVATYWDVACVTCEWDHTAVEVAICACEWAIGQGV